jgi:hypothetical protein
MMTFLFFIDFMAVWFENYSKFYAGDRFDKVQTQIDWLIQSLYDVKLMKIVVGSLAQLFLVGQYMRFNHSELLGAHVDSLFQHTNGVMFWPSAIGLIYKNVINIIEIK